MALRRALSIAALPAMLLSAQSQPTRPQFEVASVKRNDSGDRGSNLKQAHGSLDARNVILKLLISDAYGAEGF